MTFSKRWAVLLLTALTAFSYARAEDAASQELDPNGPWMICSIEADGLKNIRKKPLPKQDTLKKANCTNVTPFPTISAIFLP